MNKLRVIDLLNKIANGEEVPRKFIVDGDTLYIGEDRFIEYANGKRIEWFIYPSWLNEEVEIIEEEPRDIEVCGSLFTKSEYDKLAGIKEDKKIEELDIYNCFKVMGYDKTGRLDDNFQKISDKINEIIDKLNKGE